MKIATRGLVQRAVLWAASSPSRYGETRVNSPIEIPCRWEQGVTLANDPVANHHQVDGTVYVDQEVPLGSILRLGGLEDLPTSSNYYDGLYEVVGIGLVPNVKAQSFRRPLTIVKYKDQLPQLVA